MHYSPEEIEFPIDMVPIKSDFSKAMSLGLIPNELINDSIKHAFKGKSNKTICINLESKKKGYYKLIVCDYGIGFKDEMFEDSRETLGLALVKDIAQQLDGTIKKTPFEEEKGTHYSIIFSIPSISSFGFSDDGFFYNQII